jgi:hypothetical protein
MADGGFKSVKDICRGDILAGGKVAVCILETQFSDGFATMCTLPSGLRISAYHPVKIDGVWTFPCDIAEPQQIPCEAWYSFLVMDGDKYATDILVDNTVTITLGHGIQGDKVAKHPFFGTEAVVNALKECKGWETGKVSFTPGFMLRGEGNLVTGFDPTLEIW